MIRFYLLSAIFIFAAFELLAQPIGREDLNKKKLYNNLDSAFASPLDVYKLDLRGQKLDVITGDLSKLKNLQVLILSNNSLKALPSQIEKLKNLQILQLDKNEITELPAGLSKLKHLQEINLRYNQLRELPAQFGNLVSLEVLDVRDNVLQGLPAKWHKKDNLCTLYSWLTMK